MPDAFRDELTKLINEHSVEQCGDVPDYILAQYLCDCIEALHNAAKRRDRWFGVDHRVKTVSTDVSVHRAPETDNPM